MKCKHTQHSLRGNEKPEPILYSCVETRNYYAKYVNFMADDALARSSVTTRLTMQDKRASTRKVQPSVPSQCWEMIENENIALYLLKQIQHQHGIPKIPIIVSRDWYCWIKIVNCFRYCSLDIKLFCVMFHRITSIKQANKFRWPMTGKSVALSGRWKLRFYASINLRGS